MNKASSRKFKKYLWAPMFTHTVSITNIYTVLTQITSVSWWYNKSIHILCIDYNELL